MKLRIADSMDVDRILVVGDLHGDYASFKRIVEFFNPESDLLIFLGDYADRGDMGVEVLDGVSRLMNFHGDRVIALKGNHEDYGNGIPYFQPCTLIWEADVKRGGWMNYYNSFLRGFLDKLFLAAKYENMLFLHGGVSSKITSLKCLEYPSREVEIDVLWSDPYFEPGEKPNFRGAGVLFGPDISEMVCRALNVDFIVRSHEPLKAFKGPCVEHDGRVVTVNSTRVYGGRSFMLILPAEEKIKSGYELEEYTVWLN
ncbi:MAG TPA: serine/threonine protein phosphatase [Candidatus Bathyarchaeota archaeon]|nr:serine/threonine protein phosphatase [Candidatus Bathyarchaeota archaeon]